MVLIFAFIIIIFITLYLKNRSTKTIKPEVLEKTFKILTIIYLAFSLLDLFLPDGLSARTYPDQTLYTNLTNRLFALLRWINNLSLIVIPIAIFYKKKSFIQIVSFILPITLIILVTCSNKYIEMFRNGLGEGIMHIRFFPMDFQMFFLNKTFRKILLLIQFILEAILIIYIFTENIKLLKFNDKKEIKNFLLILLGVFLAIMPIYAPSYIFGGYYLEEDGFFNTFKIGSFWHLAWLVFLPIEIFILYRIFKRFNTENRRIAMICMSLALLFEFMGIYTCFGEIVTQRYPMQLCNLGSIIMIIMVLTNNKLLQKFTLFVNVPGAIIALFLCDSANCGVTYIMNVHYIVEHSKVISIPILYYLLGFMGEFDKNTVKDVVKSFSIYFVITLLLGGTFQGLYELTGNDYWSCNYLFMFNKEASMGIVPFVGILFDINFKIFNFFKIALIHPVIFIVMNGLLIGYFYLFNAIDKKRKKFKYDESLLYKIENKIFKPEQN